MSNIRWHFEDVTLHMGGRERAWMGGIVRRMAYAAADLLYSWPHHPPHHMSVERGGFSNALETVWAMGSRPVRLAALIHGCCESNLVVDGAAFAEVADTLEEGLASGIFREETQGYEGIRAIIERLRKGGAWCVWSYSVTGGFPCRVRRKQVPGVEPTPDQVEDCEETGEWVWLTAEQSVAYLRPKGTLEAGELAKPAMFTDTESYFKMDADRLMALVGVEEPRR